MTAPREIPIGLVGLGNVGSGVLRILDARAQDIEARLGARVVVRRIAVRDATRERAVEVDAGLLTTNYRELVEDPDIQIVVEVMGGTGDARDVLLDSVRAGKHVVTANKSLLAEHGEEIFGSASKANADVLYEAAVGGGIPIIRTLREALASDRINAIAGIVNGTTNYILGEMVSTGRGFDEVVREAQSLGYAEADPTADVDGHDAAQKLCLLAAICFGIRVQPSEVHTEGIRQLALADLRAAAEFGYIVKLLAIGRRHEDGAVELRVHPTMVPRHALLANVGGAFNALLVNSESLGPSMFYGQGAGSLPTGSAVVADIIDCARNLLLGTSGRIPHRATREEHLTELHARPMAEVQTPSYLRFTVQDEPGVLGRIATILGDHGISIDALSQQGRSVDEGPVPVIVMTHEAREQSVAEALEVIGALPFVREPTRRIRIETGPPVIE